jgi:hypothetical protein
MRPLVPGPVRMRVLPGGVEGATGICSASRHLQGVHGTANDEPAVADTGTRPVSGFGGLDALFNNVAGWGLIW